MRENDIVISNASVSRFHAVLKREIRYESLKVLDTQVLALQLNDIGTVKLPTGRRVRVRPMDLGEDGVLVAVEIEGSTQADLRVPNRRIVVIGGSGITAKHILLFTAALLITRYASRSSRRILGDHILTTVEPAPDIPR